MALYLLVFSPTGGTQKAAEALLKGFDEPYKTVDCLKQADLSALSFQKDDICVVAAPSFGGRLPQLFAMRLQTLRGNGARAVPVVVYGNRAYEDTLLELSDLLTAAGFACCAGVAAVAEHSIFRQFAAGRPDADDCAALLRFGKEIRQKLQSGDANPLEFPGNRPYKPLKDNPMKPQGTDACITCGTCARECPAGAIPKETPRVTNPALCISCMRCIAVCPVGARKNDDALLGATLERLTPLCAGRKENKLFL